MSAVPDKKFSEIYEKDEKSPVFLRIAESKINEKNYDVAIGVLNRSLSENSSNAVGFFLLGKAYMGIGNFKEALLNFKKGSRLINSDKTYNFYLKEIELLKRKTENSGKGLPKIGSSEYSALLDNSASKSTGSGPESGTDLDDNLVSETLAQIYLSQNEAGEAVKVYEKLIKKYPLKKLYFQGKITEITSGMK